MKIKFHQSQNVCFACNHWYLLEAKLVLYLEKICLHVLFIPPKAQRKYYECVKVMIMFAWIMRYFVTVESLCCMLTRLGKAHVGYSRLDFVKLKLSVVGGQSFSSGGQSLSTPRLCKRRFTYVVDHVVALLSVHLPLLLVWLLIGFLLWPTMCHR